jgi:hypothetical protein
VVYRGHGIHTWDPRDKTFLSYWFDNIGVRRSGPSRRRSKETATGYESEGPQGWQRMTCEWRDGRFEFGIDVSRDGRKTWRPAHEGRYTRAA